jgi:glycosyltransferase involved in cell wall biosynthesis
VRVAVLGSIAWRTPPRAYGPWERVGGLIAAGLHQRGIDVTLFATLDSVTPAHLDGVVAKGYADDPQADGRVCEALHVAHALARSDEFDVVHNHLDWLPLAFERHARAPLVTTVHGFSGAATMPVYRGSRSSLVSISFADRALGLRYAANVYHGVDDTDLPFDRAGGEALAFFGRIHPDKGTATAIEIARRSGRRLVICGIVQDAAYYRECVEPHVDGDRVTYLGPVGPRQRAEVLGSSSALLHPIAFAEPFGLSVVESMMCGTPTIAFALGSMPEILDHGTTGFLATDIEDAAMLVERVSDLDRAECRRVAEERFSVSRMVDEYIGVYDSVIAARPRQVAGRGWLPPPVAQP